MEGVRIFIHAVRMVLGNLNVALRVSGALLAIHLVIGLMAGEAYFSSGMGMSGGAPGEMPQFSGLMFLLSVLQIIFGLWIAVAWHRFILLEEQPGAFLPVWNGAAIWSYFKAGFVLALIVIVAVIPMMFLAGLVVLPFVAGDMGSPGLLPGLIGFAIMYLPAAYIAYRISPMLPSAAVGKRMTVKEAWQSTSTSGLSFVVLTLVSVLAGWLIYMPAGLLAGNALIIAVIWAALAQWLSILVGASILTTIYGHYVQKRELNA
ncbi:hypothetical protein [Pararhodobacter sp.]|uniref:hypothetical protein n=1 Tax=Pararhodobacter sp. TaxID=2127056 RepID=UPI002AFF1467|nr:hypothetical protein [Pararhodobacter sp.]